MARPNINVAVGGPEKPTGTAHKSVILKSGIPFAQQVTESDCTYIVKWDFDLGGQTVAMPNNCVLVFEGGEISGGTLDINGAAVYPNYNALVNDRLTINGMPKAGTFWYDEKPLWSNGTQFVDALDNLGVLGTIEVVQLTSDMVANTNPAEGTQTNVLYVNDTSTTWHVSVSNTNYRTPDGQIISLTVPAGGYGEINFMKKGGIIYARGV